MEYRESRRDLADVIAVIAIDPGYHDVMQSESPEKLSSAWEMNAREFGGILDELEAEIVRIAPEGMFESPVNFDRHFYQVGPACQGPDVQLIELARNAHAIVEIVVTYADLGTMAMQLRDWWSRRTREPDGRDRSSGGLVFTAPVIEGICVADVLNRHGEHRVTQIQSHSRQEFYGDPDHPTGTERYAVTVNVTANRQYIYSISGSGTIYENFRLDGGIVTPLEVPVPSSAFEYAIPREILRPNLAAIR